MSQEQIINYVVLIIVIGSLVIGLFSMLFGKLVDLWDVFWDWWKEGARRTAHYRPVRNNQDNASYVMSRSEANEPPSLASSLETQSQTDRQTEQAPRIKAEELLTLCKLMRAAGIGREDAAAAFKASGLPFNNNVWRDAAPTQKPDDAEYRTPIVGRPTNARFDVTDPDYPYQAPA